MCGSIWIAGFLGGHLEFIQGRSNKPGGPKGAAVQSSGLVAPFPQTPPK